MTLQEAQNKFLNKKVLIKNTTDKNQTIGGTLDFLGYNKFFPSWGLCAIVDRFPIQHVKLENISLRDK